MKNKLVSILTVVLSMLGILSISGCQSTPKSLSENSPMIIVSVTGNRSLPWKDVANGFSSSQDSDDDGNGVLTNIVNKLIDNDNPELVSGQDRIDYAAQSLHELISTTGGIEVISNDTVTATKAYQDTKESMFNMLEAIYPATNYKNIPKIGAKRSRLLMQETNAKGMLVADFFFQKENVSGNKWNGKIRARVTMKVRLTNERGKTILSHEFVSVSPDEIPLASHKYDKQALVDLFPATIDAVINQFIVSFVQ